MLHTSDPLLRSLELHIERLAAENQQLAAENAELRRLLAKSGTQPETTMSKPLSEWGARDFLAYFQELHKQRYGIPYHFSRPVYEAALTQLKGARLRYNLSNEDLKAIFDFHFANTFTERYTPTIAYICGASGMNRYYAATARTRQLSTTSPDVPNTASDPKAIQTLSARLKKRHA